MPLDQIFLPWLNVKMAQNSLTQTISFEINWHIVDTLNIWRGNNVSA